MNAKERRENIVRMVEKSPDPVSGALLAEKLKVSRQVIVQDIALLRANGTDIISTNRGYIIGHGRSQSRVFKVIHGDDETLTELNAMIDLGGRVEDVFVYHKAYGVIRAEMNLKSRRDITDYMKNITSGKSGLLKNVTSGYHYHTVSADDAETLDIIQEKLSELGFLAPLQDYEPVDFWGEVET